MSQSRAPRTWPVQLTVLGTIGVLAVLARLPDATDAEKDKLAARFQLKPHTLPAPVVGPDIVHEVNQNAPQLKYYLYQVGASAALGDLDGDGLPNDLCLTDIRAKTSTVMPVPGTGDRYAPFVVDLGPLQDIRINYQPLCRISDLNEDGLADLLVAVGGRVPVMLLRRDPGDLKPGAPISLADYAPQEVAPAGPDLWWTTTGTLADINGDGHKDLVLGNYFGDDAEINDGQSSRPFEMNDSFSRARNGGTNRILLYESSTTGPNPSVTYKDAGDVFPNKGAGGWTLAVGAADLDKDGMQDLYIANDHGADQLLWNRGTPGGEVVFQELQGKQTFTTPESMAVGHDSFKGMGIDFADINDDGVFDMYVSNIASDFGLQETHFLWTSTGKMDQMAAGIAPWVDDGDELGVSHSSWSWDSRFVDLDNDGVVEMVQATGFLKGEVNRWADFGQLGTGNDVLVKYPQVWPAIYDDSEVDGDDPNAIFVRAESGRYTNLAERILPGVGSNSRGIALADVDGDGDPDLVYANLWEDSIFIENATQGGHFLGLHVLLPATIAAPPAPEVPADAATDAATEAAPGAAEPVEAAPAAPAGVAVHDGHPTWREGVPAIGATVEVSYNGKKHFTQVDGGNGHTGQRAPDVIFGLGDAPADTELPVHLRWRDYNGAEHNHDLTLKPGWHTVVLADPGVSP